MKDNKVKKIVDEFIEKRVKHLEDPEVCIHPFAYTDSDGNVLPYQQIAEDEEIDEEDLEDVEEKIKEIAEQIEDIDLEPVISIPVDVLGNKTSLTDTVNCNILPVPLLDVAIVSNINLKITKVNLDINDESILDVHVETENIINDEVIKASGVIKEFLRIGWLTIVESLCEELEMMPVEFRGLTMPITMEEIYDIMGEDEE